MTDDVHGDFDADEVFTADEVGTADEIAEAEPTVPPQYGVGPFSIREVVLGGIWLLAFVFSFFPTYAALGVVGPSVWTGGIDWILAIALPTAAVFLLGLRRLSPDGIRRVGSLGVDQFASVAFSVAAVYWISLAWRLGAALPGGYLGTTWVTWVETVLTLGGVVFTVFAPLLPVFGEDFRHRPEALAHQNARPLRPVSPRPVAPRPVVEADATPTAAYEPVVAEPAPAPQAFWALAPEPRDVLDESGAPLFQIGPDAWALVIEDRGEVFVVRHEDGRLGYLHDVSGVTRG
ncbi:MAG: hypothetical protein QM604_00170 [Microbacterium sp.]